MKLTPGKLAGLKKVSNDRGVIAAAAMDQRGSLQKSLAKEKGGEVSDAMMEEFKTLVTEVLTPHASAILLDPEFGLEAAKARKVRMPLHIEYCRQPAYKAWKREYDRRHRAAEFGELVKGPLLEVAQMVQFLAA